MGSSAQYSTILFYFAQYDEGGRSYSKKINVTRWDAASLMSGGTLGIEILQMAFQDFLGSIVNRVRSHMQIELDGNHTFEPLYLYVDLPEKSPAPVKNRAGLSS